MQEMKALRQGPQLVARPVSITTSRGLLEGKGSTTGRVAGVKAQSPLLLARNDKNWTKLRFIRAIFFFLKYSQVTKLPLGIICRIKTSIK